VTHQTKTDDACSELKQLHRNGAAGLLEPAELQVIVADDDEILRSVVCTPLREWGFTLTEAEDGAHALRAALTSDKPLLIVLDWVMPEMSGLEVCRQVRAAGKLAYILLLTSRSGTENIAEGLRAGVDDYLVKRMSREELCVRLNLAMRVLSLQWQLRKRCAELQPASR